MAEPWRDDVPQTTDPFRLFLFVSRPHRAAAAGAMAFVVAASATGAFTPYVYKLIVDAAAGLPAGLHAPLWSAVGLYVLVFFLNAALWRGSGFVGMYWLTGVHATTRSALAAYVTEHSYQYFSDRFAGSLASKVNRAADGMAGFVSAVLWQFLGFFVSLVTGFAILMLTSPLLAGILAALLAIVVPLNVWLARKRVPLAAAFQEAETRLNGTTVDVLGNITAVHEYARRPYEMARLKGLIIGSRAANLRNWRFGEWVLTANGILQAAFVGGLLALSVALAIRGTITPGDVVLVLSLLSLFQGQLTFIGSQLNDLAQSVGQVRESLEDLLSIHEVIDRPQAPPLHVAEGSIAFERIAFSYAGRQIFDDLTLRIAGGERVGLIGRSGAGKSTLIKLLLRHYDVGGGVITVDGTDISSVAKESLRDRIAVVPQEPALFHRSVFDNIAYGRPDAALEEVVEAARFAEAHEFIEQLPDGYQTVVGERGAKLSGGQRQRVAIARAFLKNAPVLVLDEATSALDSESEAAVQRALESLMKGRTVLAIAHRLSTLRSMDRIVVLDRGKVLEEGTHEALLMRGGVYAELWARQAGGFIAEGRVEPLTPGAIA